MRRLLSFLSMAITIIAVIFLAVPTMVDTPNLGVEFNGGYEIVYEITDSDGQHDEKTTLEAAEAITKRIAIAGVENPNVEIVFCFVSSVKIDIAHFLFSFNTLFV